MDIQRTLLIVGLAVVSYLMILQWQEDYGKSPAVVTAENNAQSYPQQSDDTNSGFVVSDDLPDIPKNTAQVDVPTPDTAVLPSTDRISVKTDTVEIQIDPKGGDIVSVQLLNYAVSIDQPDTPFTLLTSTNSNIYVAQSGLIGPQGPDSAKTGRPLYQAKSDFYALEEGKEALEVDLEFIQDSGVVITKRFTFKRGQYDFNVKYLIQNNSPSNWSAGLFGQIKRDDSADPGLQSSTGFGLPTFLGAAYWSPDKRYNKIKFDEMEETPLNQKMTGGWLAFIQHYFVSAWIPDQATQHNFTTRVSKGNYIIGFASAAMDVAPGETASVSAQFYAGPKTLKNLEALTDDKGLDLAVDYGPLYFISKPLFKLLRFFQSLTGNWGIAIILLTFTVKAAFFWLSAKSYRSMAKMRKVQPKLTRMREQFGDDRQRMSQEMMKLYKDEKINPLGGCLPMLVQMPVFLALYWALLESVELRQAPFFFWIKDLSVMDAYFVLPLIMGGTMFIQQLLNPAPPDPMQARMMKIMPVIFTVFFLWFPAGLVLYWVTNNTLSIIQQWLITRSIEAGEKT